MERPLCCHGLRLLVAKEISCFLVGTLATKYGRRTLTICDFEVFHSLKYYVFIQSLDWPDPTPSPVGRILDSVQISAHTPFNISKRCTRLV
jgi:hypothetical protein